MLFKVNHAKIKNMDYYLSKNYKLLVEYIYKKYGTYDRQTNRSYKHF